MDSAPLLQGLDAADFFARHWQRRPLLLRQALPDWTCPLSPEELAGLALEPDVESRLISHQRREDRYRLEHGPFLPERFATLPERDWTLLVQAVDHWVPAVAALTRSLQNLVANWRIEDVMVSYAVEGGGVGPHYDHYDVLLIQGLGQRRWRLGPPVTEEAPLRADSPLRLLRDFEVQADYLLEPGDLLYVPPGWGHWGEAVGPCMTYSLGMRAPDEAELVAHWTEQVLTRCSPFRRYRDHARPAAGRAAWLEEEDVERARQLLLQRLDDGEGFARWLGSWLSEPRYPELFTPAEPDQAMTAATLASRLARGGRLLPRPGSRWLLQRSGGATRLCVNGYCQPLAASSLALAEQLCNLLPHRSLQPGPVSRPDCLELLCRLIDQDSLALLPADSPPDEA